MRAHIKTYGCTLNLTDCGIAANVQDSACGCANPYKKVIIKSGASKLILGAEFPVLIDGALFNVLCGKAVEDAVRVVV